MRVLCVGVATLDIIHVCEEFPLEDSKKRSLDSRLQRGGNASNISTVLSVLGVSTDFLGTLTSGPLNEYIKNDFKKYNIGINDCKEYSGYESLLSSIFINSKNGSRTIIHSHKNLPELTYLDFENVNLKNYSWIHFEGRNSDEVIKMIKYINVYNEKNEKVKFSVELEKPSVELLKLVSTADVVFVGKEFSMKNKWPNMEYTLNEMKKYVKDSAVVISCWGEKGASVMSCHGLELSPACPPEKVIDTLGAGDTFCAAAIYSMLHKRSPKETIDFACYLAGFKVGISGYDGLNNSSLKNMTRSWNLTN